MNPEEIELHLTFGPDTNGRVMEACGNCGDILSSTSHVVDARMHSGRRVELHICDLCLAALEEFANELDIPFQTIDDTPDEAALRKAVE